MTVDYKKFYRNCKSKYPFVVNELAPVSMKAEISILELHQNFLEITRFTHDELSRNFEDSRLLFIAVVIKMHDPWYFNFKQIAPYRLRKELSSLLGCSVWQISHTFKKVQNFIQVYPDFRIKIDHLYQQMKIL